MLLNVFLVLETPAKRMYILYMYKIMINEYKIDYLVKNELGFQT